MNETKVLKHFLRMLLFVAMMICYIQVMSLTTFATNDGTIDLSQYAGKEVKIYSDGYIIDDGEKNSYTGGYTLTGKTSNCSVTIEGNQNITLSDLTINYGKPFTWGHYGIKIASGSTNITLVGNNTITAGDGEGSAMPIWVAENTTLTIGGNGVLNTNSTTDGKASIGAAWNYICGNINITGGTINAKGGGNGGSVIGCSGDTYDKEGNGIIKITGGVVNCTLLNLGGNPPAIRCNNGVNITGGIVKGTVMQGATVQNCILNNCVHGDYTLKQNLEIADSDSLTVNADATLTVNEGVTLLIPAGKTLSGLGQIVNNGEIINYGTVTGSIDNNGVIYNKGTLPSGTTGTGTICEAEKQLSITLPQNQVGYTLTADKPAVTYGGDVKIKYVLKEGYSAISDKFAVKVNGEKVTLVNGEYTIENVKENITLTVEGVADITPPNATIELGTNTWNEFLNNITFGLFFNNTQSVSITGEDNGSGVKGIYYYLANEKLTETQVRVVSKWAEYNDGFSINPNNNYVIYAKVVDNADNIRYINSNGIILETAAPVISGIENGATYYTTQKVIVTDDNLDNVTVNNEEIAGEQIGEGIVLAGNVDKTYVIVAIDKAGNSATVNVTMKPISDLSKPIDSLNKDNVNSGDEQTIEDVKKAVSAVDTTYATEAEKDALKDIDEKATELEKVIDDTKAEIDRINEELKKYDSSKITAADKSNLKQLLEDVENLLEAGNLTEEERKALEGVKENIIKELNKLDADNAAKTGDNANIALWITLLIVAVLGIIGTSVYRRRKTA